MYCLSAVALTWVSRHDPFFWDTVQLGSKHAHFFFQNGLQWRPLPTGIDSGHPPVFGYYLAAIWTVFGKSLVASHFAMLPFLWLIVLLLWKIGRRLAGNSWGMTLPMLAFLDPVLLGQSVMISPDVVLVASFLLALEGIFGQKKWLVLFGILGLCAISMRGMMTATALLTWAVLLPFLKDFQGRKMLTTSLPFLPGFAFSAWFLWWHWQATGWIGYHVDSPWAGAFSRVQMFGFLKNIAIVGWRWLDFGRVGELILLGWLCYKQFIRRNQRGLRRHGAEYPVLSLLICLLVFLLPSALLYQNLSAHRYFLPAFVAAHLLVLHWLAGFDTFQGKEHALAGTTTTSVIALSAFTKKMLLGFVLLCLATGNFWVYPRGISMDWDSTLAHWPYHGLRQETVLFLESKNIDFDAVGSAFPNLNTGENLLLNGDQRQFSKKDFALNKHIIASNVFNDFSASDYAVLKAEWHLIWQKKRNSVWMEIYAKKQPPAADF